jgi:hypothetical protein
MKAHFVRLVVSAAGLAFLLATPAEAANARKHKTTVAAKQTTSKQKIRPAVARAPSSNDVYFQGLYMGTDPDPRIRHEIARDLSKFFGGDD